MNCLLISSINLIYEWDLSFAKHGGIQITIDKKAIWIHINVVCGHKWHQPAMSNMVE
jgi:hypothetical protein